MVKKSSKKKSSKSCQKLSKLGRSIVREQLNKFKWKRDGDRVCTKASAIIEPQTEWQEETGSYAKNCSTKTWQKFLKGEPIRPIAFNAFCRVLKIAPAKVAHVSKIETDWGQAPDPETFHGRERELAELKLILKNRCRLISIVGFAGIGKTKLSLKLARQFEEEFEEFEYIIWRKLYDTLPLESLLKELIKFVSDNRDELATTTEGLTEQLLRYLKERSCLLIFDNIESIERSGNRAGSYREEYEDFFKRIGTSEHLSCVLLTSRVKFSSLEEIEGRYPDAVKTVPLTGLDTQAGRKIFQDIGRKLNDEFQGTEEDWSRLISSYNGNPLALQFIARHIHNMHGCSLTQFLQQDLRLLQNIEQLFNWHFEGLTSEEQTIMYWLALNREGISMDRLREYLVSKREKKLLPRTLNSLEKKIPIERSENRFALHSLLMEYITERAIEKVHQEITSGKLELFNSHALIQASAKDYIKDDQINMILKPIRNRLIDSFGLELQNSLENRLPQLLENLNRKISGYTAGNLINLMRDAGIPIEGYNFSGMTIWEADLNTNLQNVNFAGCKFARCNFIQTFNRVKAIACHPQKDLIAIADDAGIIRLLSFDGQTNFIFGSEDESEIGNSKLAFSPDGSLLAKVSRLIISNQSCYTIKLWDTDTGNLYRTFTNKEHLFMSVSVAFSPDGQTVAISRNDSYPTFANSTNVHLNESSMISLWDIQTNEHRILQPEKPSSIYGMIFHRRENLLACAYQDAFCMWDAATEELLYTLDDFKCGQKTFDFHPTDKILVAGCSDGTIKTLNAQTGEILKDWKSHTKQLLSVSFSGDGRKIISIGKDGTIKTLNAQTGRILETSEIDVEDVSIIQFISQKNALAIYHQNRKLLKLWNVDTKKDIKTWKGCKKIFTEKDFNKPGGYTYTHNTIAISPDVQIIASSRSDRIVRAWDLNGKLISTWKLEHKYLTRKFFSPDVQTLMSLTNSSNCQIIEFWDVLTGERQKTFELPFVGSISEFEFSADGRLLACYNHSTVDCIIVWDLKTKKSWTIEVGCLREENANSWRVANIAFNYDGQYLAATSHLSLETREEYTIKIWNVKTKELHRNLICPSNVAIFIMKFHPNDRLLIGISWDGKQIAFWDLQTDRSKLIQLSEDYIKVHDLFFDEQGNILIVRSSGSTIEILQIDITEIWSADTAARSIQLLENHSFPIAEAKATLDGRTLVSCDVTGIIWRRNLETQQTPELIHSDRIYEGMNISGVEGLTNVEINTLITLGAVE